MISLRIEGVFRQFTPQNHKVEVLDQSKWSLFIKFSAFINACKSFINHAKEAVKKFTKPESVSLAAGALSNIARSRKALLAENAILHQQFIVLKRQVKRPKFTDGDRLKLVFLSRLTRFWDKALHLIQPQTLLRWHRDLYRRYWQRISKSEKRKPRIPQETIDLIKEMAQQNWLWGAEKIQGGLLKLGIK